MNTFAGMPRFTSLYIKNSIHNGDEEILFSIAADYFPKARRWLRKKGVRDSDTAAIFSLGLVSAYREIQRKELSAKPDFESLLFDKLLDACTAGQPGDPETEIIARCFDIMEADSKRLLVARFAAGQSYETIAARMDFSNAMIAEHEVNKAMNQLERIAAARLNFPAHDALGS
jgi:hypothetical protein